VAVSSRFGSLPPLAQIPALVRKRVCELMQEAAWPCSRKAESGIESMQPRVKGKVRFLRGEVPLRYATLCDWTEA